MTQDKPVKTKILILAPFFQREDSPWINDFCDRPDLEFWKAPNFIQQKSWHNRGRTTPLQEWFGFFRYAHQALKWNPDCVVTCFPQLAFVVALLLRLRPSSTTKMLAWTFNLGSLPGGWKQKLAKVVLSRVDCFVVHARSEIISYGNWLNLEKHKFQFVALQKGKIEKPEPSPIERPYIVSMGSANRDYDTLLAAVLGIGVKLVIISKETVTKLMPDHPDLVKLHGLTENECICILNGAELNVVPVRDGKTASGQVTLINSMRLGIPTIATSCVGTVDYISDGITGLLVPSGDSVALRNAVLSLLQNPDLRSKIGAAGSAKSEECFSDPAAAQSLSRIIDRLCFGR
jgi:glycosyltransferase involved in cell wall biosynthesis